MGGGGGGNELSDVNLMGAYGEGAKRVEEGEVSILQ